MIQEEAVLTVMFPQVAVLAVMTQEEAFLAGMIQEEAVLPVMVPQMTVLALMVQEEAVLAVMIQEEAVLRCGDEFLRWHALPTAQNMACVNKTAHVVVTRAGEVEDVRRACIS